MYWTFKSPMTGNPVPVLCDEHALDEINNASAPFGLGPFDDVEEATLTLDAVVAVFGGGEEEAFGWVSTETGVCVKCDYEEATRRLAETDGAA